MSQAIPAEDLRDEFLLTLAGYAHYWATLPDKTALERCNGFAFSVLAMLDGCNMGLPAFDLVARPHPDDKALLQAEGRDWIEDGTVITDTMLHEFWSRYERDERGTPP
jgi:hypothetical protein